MSFDLFFRFILIFFAAAYGYALVRALRSGRWPEAGRIHPRAEAPLAYWREIGLAIFRILLAAAAWFLVPPPSAAVPYPPYAPAFFLILILPGLIRAVWAGEIIFGINRWGRRGPPYWVMLLIGLAVVGFFAFSLVRGLGAA